MFSAKAFKSLSNLAKINAYSHNSIIYNPLRRLHLHEYQAARLLAKYNLPVLLVKII